MKVYATITREYKCLIRHTCDICGYFSGKTENWADGCEGHEEGEFAITNVSLETLDDNGHQQISADICPLCFTSRLVPWLESQGVTVQITDLDKE